MKRRKMRWPRDSKGRFTKRFSNYRKFAKKFRGKRLAKAMKKKIARAWRSL